VDRPFDAAMMGEYRFDFMKMDGEGCELQLLKVERLPTPAVVESHSAENTDALGRKFKATVLREEANGSLLIIR